MIGNGDKKTVILIVIILLSILFSNIIVFGEVESVRLEIDTLNLQKGVSVNMTLVLENINQAELKGIKGMENFEELSRSQSTSTSTINGEQSFSIEVKYTIMPKTVGEFILQASIEYNGKIYNTNELKVIVTEGNADIEGDVEDVFVKTIITSDEIYFGQKVGLIYELYTRYNIENYGFNEVVNIDGFIQNEVQHEELDGNIVYVNGNKYLKYIVKEIYLSPIKTGEFTVPSYKFQANIITSGGFFSSSEPRYFQTEEKTVTVKSLPLNGQPSNFSGIVGNLKIEGAYSRNEIELGDSLTLNLVISGICNLEGLNKVISEDIIGLSIYETLKSKEESIIESEYFSKKEYEIIFVPKESGNLEIKPEGISYFNIDTNEYELAQLPEIVVKVNSKGIEETSSKTENIKNEIIEINQVSYNDEKEGYFNIYIKKSLLLLGVFIFIFFGILVFIILYIKDSRKRHDKNLLNFYKAIKRTKNKDELRDIVNSMIKYCFDISIKASSREIIEDRIKDKELREKIYESFDTEAVNLKYNTIEIYKKLKNIGICK